LGSARKSVLLTLDMVMGAFSLILGVVLTSPGNLMSVLDFVELWIKFHVTFDHSWLLTKT